MKQTLLKRVASWLSRLGTFVAWQGYRLDEYARRNDPRCLDCGQRLDGEDCEVCATAQAEEREHSAVYDGGYIDGFREAEDMYR